MLGRLFQPRDLVSQDILPVLALLMQLSFTPDHRCAMAQLGSNAFQSIEAVD